LTLRELSDEDILILRTKNRQAGSVILALIVLMLAMSLIVANYLVAVTTWAMIPAVDGYIKRRRAINQQIRLRGLR
jgi:hypothetical protein